MGVGVPEKGLKRESDRRMRGPEAVAGKDGRGMESHRLRDGWKTMAEEMEYDDEEEEKRRKKGSRGNGREGGRDRMEERKEREMDRRRRRTEMGSLERISSWMELGRSSHGNEVASMAFDVHEWSLNEGFLFIYLA